MRLSFLTLAVILLAAPLRAGEEELPFDDDYIRGILHNIYYWYLDDKTYFEDDTDRVVEVLIAPVEVEQDRGHRSRHYEMIVPDLDLGVDLTRSDYTIEELGLVIRNDGFKIVSVHTETREPGPGKGYTAKRFSEEELFSRLMSRRNEKVPPAGKTVGRLRKGLKEMMSMEPPANRERVQTFYIGPLSPYSNDIWVFWEEERKILLFSSDSDIDTDAYWAHLPLFTTVYELEGDVVAALDEVPGSNAYVTKNWAGRVLYNCIVDGYKMEIRYRGRRAGGNGKGVRIRQ